MTAGRLVEGPGARRARLAPAGPLANSQLDPLVHGDHFWFAWAAFEPATTIWTAP